MICGKIEEEMSNSLFVLVVPPRNSKDVKQITRRPLASSFSRFNQPPRKIRANFLFSTKLHTIRKNSIRSLRGISTFLGATSYR